LDWEIAELGQPLLDLGCLCSMTVRRRFADAPSPGGAVAIEMDELFTLYGVDADEMRWYVALSLYKYAAILGYNLMLHRKGRRPDPMYEGLTGTIVKPSYIGSGRLPYEGLTGTIVCMIDEGIT